MQTHTHTHTHAQTVYGRAFVDPWLLLWKFSGKTGDDSHRLGGGGDGCSWCDLLIMQLMHLPHEMDRDSLTCQCVTETLKWKIHLEVPWGVTLPQFVSSASPSSSSTHVRAHLYSAPSILSLVTTPPGCLCQCSSRNGLVRWGWNNLWPVANR